MEPHISSTAFAPSAPVLPLGSVTTRALQAAPPTRALRPLARRARTTPPCMVLNQLRSKAALFLANLRPMDASTKAESQTDKPLDGSRSTVLVTGANGKLGSAIVQALLESGAATQVLAHISPESETPDWNAKRVAVVRADLGTEAGIGEVTSAATNAGVGSVVFAASGGPPACGAVDNAGVRRLAAALTSELGERPTGDVAPLFDFATSPGAVAAFAPLDDVIMGGRSESGMSHQPDEGCARFSGNVTTLGGGGFAQTRAILSVSSLGKTSSDTVDLSEFDGIQLRVRGDGAARVYKMNLKDEEVPDFAYQAAFTVLPGERWQTVRLPFTSFVPMKRGRPQYADGPGESVYATALDTTRVRSVGIVLSLVSDGLFKVANVREREGEFKLDIGMIGAYIAAPPRFVLVSSAAVTRPFWGADERARKGEAKANIPIVQLNPGLILGHKLAGENALRAGDISYAVLRPIGLNDEVSSGRILALGQGDTLSGRMTRSDVARGVVGTLRAPAAAYKTFELGALADEPADTDDAGVTDAAFSRLMPDEFHLQYPAQVDKMLVNAQ